MIKQNYFTLSFLIILRTFAFSLVFIFAIDSFAVTTDVYSSIAFSPSLGVVGVSWGWPASASGAEDVAIGECGFPDCQKIVDASGGLFAVLAVGANRKIGWARDANQTLARTSALKQCQTYDTDCQVIAFVGPSRGATYFRKNEAQTVAKIVGGEFKLKIANFLGVKQLKDEWCWAAVTQAIYYAMSGLHLTQAKLANMQFSAQQTLTENVVVSNCKDGVHGATSGCDHPGNVKEALQFLGLLYHATDYPQTNDIGTNLKLLRESLKVGIPVGIEIDWFECQIGNVTVYGSQCGTHELLVFGARFSIVPHADQLSGLVLELDVYDPFDGKTRVISSGERYEDNGNFDWKMAIADYVSFRKNAPPSPEICSFLTVADKSSDKSKCVH